MSMSTCGTIISIPPDLPGLPRDDGGPVFREPWEAQAFALAVNLHARGHFGWPEFADSLSQTIRAAPERPYYEQWLAALEDLVARKGLA